MPTSRHRFRALLGTGSLAAMVVTVDLARAAGADVQMTPLTAASGPRGRTLFANLAADETGVRCENRYADPKMWWERKEEFKYGSIGTGVAIGDYDNDGRPDIFVVSRTETSRLFRNLGHWKFEDVTERAGLLPDAGIVGGGVAWLKRAVGQQPDQVPNEFWGQGATFVDVDNDGWLDLYVCRFNAPNLLFMNQHDGTFKEEAAARGLALRDGSVMAAFCDFDRDGALDVYLCTNLLDATTHPSGQRDYLLHNDGHGHFTDVTAAARISGENQPHSATWWDYDGDGWPDIYVANDFAPADSLYHNNRDGTFTNRLNETVPHTPHSSMGADLGDVNNDGLIDFFVADMAATTREKDQRGMAHNRSLLSSMVESTEVAPQYMRNALYLSTGTPSFREVAKLAGLEASDWTWSPRLEDFDNDGRIDLFVTNGMVRELHNVDLNQRIAETENLREGARILQNSPVLAEPNLAFRNLGDLQFERVGPKWGVDQKGVSFGSATGDLDGDGDLDLVIANYQANPTLLRNDEQDGHRLIVALRGTRSNRFGVGAVVRISSPKVGRQVRTLVLARGYASSSEPVLHFGLGPDTSVTELSVTWPSGTVQQLERIPVDQRLVITEPAGADATPAPPKAAAQPTLFTEVSASVGLQHRVPESPQLLEVPQPLAPFRQNGRGPALAVGDVNGDGHDDLVLGGTTAVPARILIRQRDGGYATAEPMPAVDAVADDGPMLLFDADGDGTTDLLLTKSGASRPAGDPGYQPRLLFHDRAGQWRAAAPDALPSFPTSVGAAAAADFNRDGQIDVFLGGRVVPGNYPTAPRSALWINRGGRFEDVTDALAPGLGNAGLVTSALWSDVDGDGWPDLLVAVEWGTVRYFHNDQGRGFTDATHDAGFDSAGHGWWTALAAADFNGDGRMDYAVGNVGLNTPYHVGPQAPIVWFYGIPGRKGEAQILEAEHAGDRLYPRRSRDELARPFPDLRRRFPRNDLYAHATVSDLFGDAVLAAATKYTAEELRSGVFLSSEDGRYRFIALPRIAQIAPTQGLVAADVNGDGHVDLVLAQNCFGLDPAIGRFDGGIGQVLLGDGRGGFAPMPPTESGVVIARDGKAAVAADLDEDGWVDVVVSRNNDTTLAFRNSGAGGRRPLAITLRTAQGQPVIGARVTLEFEGGRWIAETQAGGGYFSQSGATCFFDYDALKPPRRVLVRWPSGESTVHTAPEWPARLTITQPKS